MFSNVVWFRATLNSRESSAHDSYAYVYAYVADVIPSAQASMLMFALTSRLSSRTHKLLMLMFMLVSRLSSLAHKLLMLMMMLM